LTDTLSTTHRLADLTITQVAGVDWPAHLADGWAVVKSASGAPDLTAALDTERPGISERIGKATSLTDLDGDDQATVAAMVDRLIELLGDDGDDDPNGDRTFGDIRSQVSDALRVKYSGSANPDIYDGCPWVCDLNDDWVVYEINSGVNVGKWQAGYTIDPTGAVTFDDPTPVAERTTYVPTSKSTDAPTGADQKGEGMPDLIDKAALPDNLRAHLDQLEKDKGDLAAELETTKADLAKAAGTATTDVDDIYKGLDPAVAAHFRKQAADLTAAQDIAKSERDHRIDQEYIAKAANVTVPGDCSKIAKAMRQADEIGGDFAETFTQILRHADEMARQAGITKSIGSDGTADDSGSAAQKLDNMVKARAAEDRVSIAKAYTIVLATAEGEALYTESQRSVA
jgi:hypothetical protein